MAIAFVSNGTIANSSSANTLSPGVPASVAAGDLMVAVVGIKNNNTISTPSTWNLIQQTNSGTAWSAGVFWKVANNAEVAPTFTWPTSVNCMAVISRYTGASNISPIGTVSTVATGTSTTANSPSITTTGKNSLVISIVTSSSNTSITNATGWTTELNINGGRETIEQAGQTFSTLGSVTPIANNTVGSSNSTAQQIELLIPVVNVNATQALATMGVGVVTPTFPVQNITITQVLATTTARNAIPTISGLSTQVLATTGIGSVNPIFQVQTVLCPPAIATTSAISMGGDILIIGFDYRVQISGNVAVQIGDGVSVFIGIV